MSGIVLRLTVPAEMTDEVANLAKNVGASVSEPQPAASTANPLNAPITFGDIEAAAQLLTVVFTAGTAAVKFLTAVLALRPTPDKKITVLNSKSRKSAVLGRETDIQKHIGE